MIDTSKLCRLALGGNFYAIHELVGRFEAAEKERTIDEQRVADLMAELNRVGQENEELRVRIEEMERQEPVAWMHPSGGVLRTLGTGLERATHTIPLYALPGAQPAPSIPEGWKLVPIEPTPKMMRAAQKADHDHGNHEEWLEYDGEDVKRVYRAMLAAAPEAKP